MYPACMSLSFEIANLPLCMALYVISVRQAVVF